LVRLLGVPGVIYRERRRYEKVVVDSNSFCNGGNPYRLLNLLSTLGRKRQSEPLGIFFGKRYRATNTF
jgi:hypothetical protein